MKTIIGLEIHVQLKTKSKLFCNCETDYLTAKPNENTCVVCAAHPGSKPYFINEEAMKNAVKIGSALNCKMNDEIIMQRKHYFYPDLPNGFQRTSKPLGVNGSLEGVKIREVHIEEDPGRYDLKTGKTDYNRCGVPLIEIVTDPEIKDADHAKTFLEELQLILSYLEASREEPGSSRVDANLSIEGHARIEVKNINSFKGVYIALQYEERRQKKLIEEGVEYGQETRHFDEEKGITIGLRKKETLDDYRYSPDPDVPPIIITKSEEIPELPKQKRERFEKEFNITKEEASTITSEKRMADAFEKISRQCNPKLLVKLFRGVLKKQLNYRDLKYNEKFTSELLWIEKAIEENKITEKSAESILIEVIDKNKKAEQIAVENNLLGIETNIDEVIGKIIKENKKAVDDYKKGEEKALNYLIGKIMKETKGKADKNKAMEILKKNV
jgi:aspartyl-tRNA(Asn)/glutamyl-tRNA(Gln) amidotransferase subunit B